jgi:hypothetical protein
VAKARVEWREQQSKLTPSKLVFTDETWVKTNMTRRYGRAKCGHRLVAAVPHGHWKTTTFVGALRCDGLTAPLAISSSWTICGPIKLPVCGRPSRQSVQNCYSFYPDLNPIELAFATCRAGLAVTTSA